MKNTLLSIKKHLMYKYSLDDENSRNSKSTNINVLLNRVKLDQKRESRKKYCLQLQLHWSCFIWRFNF